MTGKRLRSLAATLMLGTLTLSSGCKSDCEKLYDHSLALIEKTGKAEALEKAKQADEKKKFVETTCKEFSEEQIKCMLGKDDQKEFFSCIGLKKKEGKK